MKHFLICLSLLVFFYDVAHGQAARQQGTYDIYYLAVGNSHYVTDRLGQGFQNLEGANKSARTVARYLDRAGAVSGITLVSESNKVVTKKDVLTALHSLLARLKRSSSGKAVVIFYFCGHGASEGIGWNHFSIPGDFAVPIEKANIDTLSEAAIHAGEVSDAIEKHKVQCILLLDTCYEGKEIDLATNAVISDQLAQNLTDIFKSLRALNEFRGPAIAVFSTRPGTVVKTVADPMEPDSPLGMGPLARRFVLVFEGAFQKKGQLTVGQFLEQMSSRLFDQLTNSVITLSKPEAPNMVLIKYPLSDKTPVN